jgi:hypothetical protein
MQRALAAQLPVEARDFDDDLAIDRRAGCPRIHRHPSYSPQTLVFKDTVVQDDDLSRDPSEELDDEARPERVHAGAERGVQGGRRGPTARPALGVPTEIVDQATGEVLDVVEDDDPDLPPEPPSGAGFA